MAETPEKTRGGEAREDHHDELVGKSALHVVFLSRYSAVDDPGIYFWFLSAVAKLTHQRLLPEAPLAGF
jgi:hypothetical protein